MKAVISVVVSCFILAFAFLFSQIQGVKRADPEPHEAQASEKSVELARLEKVAGMPAELEAVVVKLKELNPNFDGAVTHKSEKGVVTELKFETDAVTDLSPLRALTGLRILNVAGSFQIKKGPLTDLSPLSGMKLTNLNCSNTQVADLSPLKGTRLEILDCSFTLVSDLSPLKETSLTALNCSYTKVVDLSPLRAFGKNDPN